MASAWNIVRGSTYGNVPGNNENGLAESPLPDKFKQRFTVNSLRMSLRKRMPLKRINSNTTPAVKNDGGMKKKKPVADIRVSHTTDRVLRNKNHGLAVEKTVKKTFYRVTEQLTGNAKKSQLKDTPQKMTPRSRYRERLRSPPGTPMSPLNPFDSPCCSTPIGQVETIRRRVTRTPRGKRHQRRTPRKSTGQKTKQDPDDFSRHLELVSSGIQQLEANSNNMTTAISHIGEDYLSSPLQSKIRSQHRLWRDEMKRYVPTDANSECNFTDSISDHALQSINTRSKLRRTMTRMSMRVKSRSALRSTQSASNISTHCYNGPMSSEPRKLAPLQSYVKQCDG